MGTEKTFKAFYYFQIPIFVAQYNHVNALREEYDRGEREGWSTGYDTGNSRHMPFTISYR